MRADNDGEGGILALFALAKRKLVGGSPWARIVIALALAGTAFFFCDALITPAISVLSAVEGLELLDPGFAQYVIPVTIAVLAGAVPRSRSRGTARVGEPVRPGHDRVVHRARHHRRAGHRSRTRRCCRRSIRATASSCCGIDRGSRSRSSARCSWPSPAARRCMRTWATSASNPVRIAWFTLVWPALMINYFGQGALLLQAGHADHASRCIALVPPPLLPWMVVLATAATVIASQATISGAFSMARQAVQLDLLPRMRVLQTSAHEQGQIYVPIVNWLVFVAVVAVRGWVRLLGCAVGRVWRRRRRHHVRSPPFSARSSRPRSGTGRSGGRACCSA